MAWFCTWNGIAGRRWPIYETTAPFNSAPKNIARFTYALWRPGLGWHTRNQVSGPCTVTAGATFSSPPVVRLGATNSHARVCGARHSAPHRTQRFGQEGQFARLAQRQVRQDAQTAHLMTAKCVALRRTCIRLGSFPMDWHQSCYSNLPIGNPSPLGLHHHPIDSTAFFHGNSDCD